MRDLAKSLIEELLEKWSSTTLQEILLFCQENEIIEGSERLSRHLERPPRDEEYNENLHEVDKEDWLADEFFKMSTDEIEPYANFINEHNTIQHSTRCEGAKNIKMLLWFMMILKQRGAITASQKCLSRR